MAAVQNQNNNNNQPTVTDSPPTPDNNNNQIQTQTQIDQNQPIDLNNVVLDLGQISNLAKQKIMDYADITGTFKEISKICDNLALVLATYLQQQGKLDSTKFKLQKI